MIPVPTGLAVKPVHVDALDPSAGPVASPPGGATSTISASSSSIYFGED
jgi:hypothetical protein